MRVPHRDDPRDPWSPSEIGPYAAEPDGAPYLEVDIGDSDHPVLYGPNGEPLTDDRIPFGFQAPPTNR